MSFKSSIDQCHEKCLIVKVLFPFSLMIKHIFNIHKVVNNFKMSAMPFSQQSCCEKDMVYIVSVALPLLYSGSCQSVLVLSSSQVQLT